MRGTKFSDVQTPVVSTIEDQHKYDMPTLRRLGVYAEATNQYVSPAATDAMKLADALKEAKPGLEVAIAGWQKQVDEQDIMQGMKDSRGAGRQTPTDQEAALANRSKKYAEGYLRLQGHLAGVEDRQKMVLEWDGVPNKDQVNFTEWSSKWWQQNTKGLDNPHYLAGYTPVMGESIDKQKALDTQIKVEEQVTRVNASVQETFKSALRDDMARKVPINMEWFERVRNIGPMVGRDKAQTTALFAESIKQMADTAQTPEDVRAVIAATALMKEKALDGTPIFAKHIGEADRLVTTAQQRVLAMFETQDKADAFDRKRAREDFEFDIAKLVASGNADEALAKVKELAADPKARSYFDAQGLLTYHNTIKTLAKKEETEEQKLRLAQLLPDAHELKIGYDKVRDAVEKGDISVTGASTLYAAIKSAKQAEKTLNASYAAMGRAFTRDPVYQASLNTLQSLPLSTPDDPQGMGGTGMMLRYQKAAATEQFVREVANGLKPEQYSTRAQQLYDGVMRTLNNVTQGGHNVQAYINPPTKYKNPAALAEAYRSGQATHKEFDEGMQYFSKAIPAPSPARVPGK